MHTAIVPSIAGLPGLEDDLSDTLIAQLNGTLATMTDLVAVYKQAHWNVLGPDFALLHDLFEQFAVETRTYTDLIAERATTLGGAAHGTLQAAADATSLPPFPRDERDQTRLLDELARRLDRVVADVRNAIDSTASEPATQDLYVAVARGLEKQRWMVLAHLAHQSGNGRSR
jgi:starvation-inducible DNA-binding protein